MNALFIDANTVTEAKSREVMAGLQEDYAGRLAWVANPANW